MAVYSISSINVKDWDKYQEYMKHVPAIIEQYGGRFLVRGGEIIAVGTPEDVSKIKSILIP